MSIRFHSEVLISEVLVLTWGIRPYDLYNHSFYDFWKYECCNVDRVWGGGFVQGSCTVDGRMAAEEGL